MFANGKKAQETGAYMCQLRKLWMPHEANIRIYTGLTLKPGN